MEGRIAKRLRGSRRLAALACVGLAAGAAGSASASQADYDQGYDLGTEAYKYGLPLVTMNKTYKNQTSIDVSNGHGFGPANQFNPVRQFADPTTARSSRRTSTRSTTSPGST